VRVVLIGGSALMAWIVAQVAPADLEIEHRSGFAEAKLVLVTRTPDAVLFALTPERPPWNELLRWCRQQQPPVPFAVYFGRDSATGDVDPPRRAAGDDSAHAGAVPPSRDELWHKLDRLQEAVARCHENAARVE